MQSLAGYASQEAWDADQKALFIFEEDEQHYAGSHIAPFIEVEEALKSLPDILPNAVVSQSYADMTSLTPPYPCSLPFPKAASLAYPNHRGDLVALILIEEDANRFASMFPYKWAGKTFDATIDQVYVWDNGVEGQVEIDTHGFLLTFFDTHFISDKEFFVSAGKYGFSLLGIGYDIGYPEKNELTVKMKKEVLQVMGEEVEADTDKVFSLQGMKTFMNIGQDERDEYSFRGSILSVKNETMMGLSIYLITIDALRNIDDETFELPVIVSHKAWKESEVPKVGDEIEGILWLQGRMLHIY